MPFLDKILQKSAMKERGKAVETQNSTGYNYSAPDNPCQKHPSSSSVGICAQCLKDRLIKLVCSDCGEQRLSSCSCSCSEFSSYRNSSATAEVGSVGRISFLLESQRFEPKQPHSKPQDGDVVMLKRSSSSSSCSDVKRRGIWKIVRFFRKKRGRTGDTSSGGFDEKSEMWVVDYMGVSRSRSLCSFRGGGFNEESSDLTFSSAKTSDFNGGGLVADSRRPSGVSEAEPRKSGCKLVMDEQDSGFIDLRLDLSSGPKTECSTLRGNDPPARVADSVGLRSGSFLGHHECGGSCRITGVKKGKKGYKVWRWILKHQPTNWRSASKKDESLHVIKI